ncbi:sigma-70 family RNA polymerase sigma factor [Isoptericola jiangsuensis]|uniref:sigma-70 family RNA polymerase sigma factor n=1 Tax=Isoptericola jiangsuensis TaxID=548579 RepID=UPI003AADC8EA
MTDVYVGSDGSAPSDGELILEVRSGSLDAYGALYARHAAAAKALARQYVRSESDADDVVAEAFHRVLGVLQQGNGPDTHFRAYLFTVVRRLAADLAKGARRLRPTDDDGTFELALGPSSSPEDPALAGFESSVVARAYEGLPERWQAVLWYTEVEGMSPADVAPILGLTANGVSALAYRAREGLRVGYLQEHLTAEPADTCRTVNPLLGGYVRGSLSRREIGKVDKHLEDCGGCRTLVLELGDVAHGMRTVIAPLVVGIAGLALLGALPLGAAVLGAGGAGAGAAAGAAGAAGTAAGGVGTATGAGTVGAGASGAFTGAGAGAGAGVGTTAGAGATVGAGATAGGTAAGGAAAGGAAAGGAAAGGAAGTAATAGSAATMATAATATTATAATASTATSVATTAVLATSTAGISGVTVAASTGAVAAATVGVVTMLGAMGGGEPAEPPAAPPAAEAAQFPSEEAVLPTPTASPAPEPSADPTNPANVPALVDPDVVRAVAVPAPAAVGVSVADAGDVLQPRVAEGIDLTVSNSGGTTAHDTLVRVDLPTGMRVARTASYGGSAAPAASTPGSSTSGTSAGGSSAGGSSTGGSTAGGSSAAAPLDVTTLPCTPTDVAAQALCRIGTLEPGATRTVTVPVRADAGGSYDVAVKTWADGVEPRTATLPSAQVAYFGSELTATTGAVAAVVNPGRADVTFRVQNTGDRPAASGWETRVRVPAGLVPQSITGDLACETDATAKDSGTNVWRCTGAELAPGASVAGVATVVADGTTSEGDYELAVVPVLPDDQPALRSAATVSVGRAWAGAASGGGPAAASCAATGGVGVADAVVTSTYRNQTALTLRVRMGAAGSWASAGEPLAPGDAVTVVVPDGLRVPGGTVTWNVSTSVAGTTYERDVLGGRHEQAECYSPSWKVESSAEVVNDGGRVRVEGTITNQGSEPMQASMSAAGDRSGAARLGGGETLTFGITTDKTALDAGSVTFDLFRWVTDFDGDQPSAGVVPATTPTATYRGATIAPAAGQADRAGECTYDASQETSTRAFTVPLDNSGSTLPVAFVVRAGGDPVRVTLGAGEKKTVEVQVPWGTRTGTVTADGRDLRTLDVGFGSCAQSPGWPGSVTVSTAPQCTDGVASLAVDVVNSGGRTWRAVVERGDERLGSTTLSGGGSAGFTGGAGKAWLRSGSVTVKLSRSIEGTEFTVEKVVDHDRVRCVVVDPRARIDDGEVQTDRYDAYVTSWRKVGVVLDNTRSTVPVTFQVIGPHGLDESTKVPAGETRTVEGPRVDGRQGASYTVKTRTWSTTLETGTFTAAESGWCAERIAWGTEYQAGDVRSWNGYAFRYQGWSGTPPEGAAAEGDGARWWKDGRWNGQWREWEKLSLCEYR